MRPLIVLVVSAALSGCVSAQGTGARSATEMVKADGSPVDARMLEQCRMAAGMRTRDTELASRGLAKGERLSTAEFADTYRRSASYFTCLDRLGYVFRTRVSR